MTDYGKRVLVAASGAHLIQDGLVALQYVLLPILAQAFGLSYAQVGLLRALNSGAMTLFEIPSGVLSERLGEVRLLAFGLLCAAFGFLFVAHAEGFYLIAAGFLVAGSGAAFQHSLASALIANSHDDASRRRALGIYNSFGDVGKLAFTGLFSLAVGVGLAWNLVVSLLALVTIGFTVLLLFLLRRPRAEATASAAGRVPASGKGRWGIEQPREFTWYCLTLSIDCMVQTVFLTFVAFVLLEKGGSESQATLAVLLVLIGGMVGKFVSGFFAVRYGDRGAFRILQVMTLASLLLLLVLPVLATLALLPLAGVVLQGSSTVTYGALGDFVRADRQARGYAVIYSIGGLAAVIGVMAFGGLADLYGIDAAMGMLVLMTGLTLFSCKSLRKTVPLAQV